MRASERGVKKGKKSNTERSAHLFFFFTEVKTFALSSDSRHAHPTRSPDLSISRVFSQPEKNKQRNPKKKKKKRKLPQSTQKLRLVSHTLAAKSPQGRGGDEAECLLVAVKS